MVSSASFMGRQTVHTMLPRVRNIIGDSAHTGEVLFVASCGLSGLKIWPLGPLPHWVEAELSLTCEDDRSLFVAMDDIVEEGLVPFVGMKVLFKLYMGRTGFGGCEVTSA